MRHFKHVQFVAIFALGCILAAVDAQQAKTETGGDAAPPGALFRFGSMRLRHPGGIRSSALSPDGKLLATASGRSVIVWDLGIDSRVARFLCPDGGAFASPGLSFSPDAKRLGYLHSYEFGCVWDLPTRKEILRLKEKPGHPHAMGHFSMDGNEFITSDGKNIRYWDLASGKEVRAVAATGVNMLSPDAAVYVRVDEKAVTVLGDARTGKVIRELQAPAAKNGGENGLAFSPDGKWLALVHMDKAVELRETGNWAVRGAFPLPAKALRNQDGRRYPDDYHVGLTNDGVMLFLGMADGKLHRWDVAKKAELATLPIHKGRVAGIHHLPGTRTLLTTGADGLIRRWDLDTGHARSEPDGYVAPTCAALSADGRQVVIGDERGRLDLWDATTGKQLRALRQKGPAVTQVAFGPGGKMLAVADAAGVRILDAANGKEQRTVVDEKQRNLTNVNLVLFSPDGKYLGVNSTDLGFHQWDADTGKLIWAGSGLQVRPAAYAADSSSLATVFIGPGVLVLDFATGKERSRFVINRDADRQDNYPQALAISPNGRILAAGLGDRIILCDAATGAEVTRFRGVAEVPRDFNRDRLGGRPVNNVQTLQFSPDGRWLISGGSDQALRIWEVVTAKQVLEIHGHESSVQGVAFTPDMRRAFSYGQDAEAYLWDLRPAPTKESLDELWQHLAAPQADRAYRAIWALSEHSQAAAKLFASKIPPVQPVEKDRLNKLLADLNSSTFATRDAAMRELTSLGDRAKSSVEQALSEKPTLEVQRRLTKLLAELKREPTLDELRELRAVQALELSGSKEVRAVLLAWANGAPGARLTEDARAALRRLAAK